MPEPAETPHPERDAPAPGSQEPDQPAASPDADAVPEGAASAATAASGAQEAGDGEAGTGPRSAAMFVAAGIFLSRIIGFVRERAVGYFFGVGEHADVFRAVLRMPNLLQNLLGEGSISAAFIPIYSRMLDQGRPEDAGRFAGAVLGLLTALVGAIVAFGVTFAEPITTVLAPGFVGDAARVAAGEVAVDRFRLAVSAVRFTFPMAGILVLSAWALGVLNSHRKFFLPYFAPVLWNVAIIGGMIVASVYVLDDPLAIGQMDVVPVADLNALFFGGVYGAVVGGLLQFVVQVPAVVRVIRGFRFSFSTKVEGVRQSFKAFLPVVAGRGVYQLSGYLDMVLATFLAAGALAALVNAQVLYMLPVALFAMSVAASELPELSRLTAGRRDAFLARTDRSVRQIAYMVIPTAVGYIGFGFLVVAVLYRTGRFGLEDNWLVYFVLAAYAFGLIATTTSRLLQNAFYALDDTKTPAKIAVVRVIASTAVGAGLMLWLDQFSVPDLVGIQATGRPLRLGAVGLAVGATVGAWVELWRLNASLRTRLDGFALPWGRMAAMFGLAGLAAIPAALLRLLVSPEPFPIWLYGLFILAVYGFSYLGLGMLFKFDEGDAWIGRFTRRFRKKREA
jgi:putative peptidoglycan lipid II flippase